MRLYLIKLLFRLLDGKLSFTQPSGDKITKLLYDLYANKTFIEYMHYRDMQILKEMGNCVGRDKYLELVGMRKELMKLLFESKQAYMVLDKK